MTDFATLYQQAKPELQTMADPLLDFATQQVTTRGGFLPFGATLTEEGRVERQAAAPAAAVVSGDEVLPLLLAGLQRIAAAGARAVAVCEWVRIGSEGGALTDAVKVSVHHRGGVAVAFYLPATKPLLRSWRFGEIIARSAAALIDTWSVAAGA